MTFHRASLTSLPLLLACAALVVGTPAFARPNSDANQTKHLEIADSVTVNGTALSPGNYEVVIDNGKATFEHGGQTIATADCEWKTGTSKPQFTQFVVDKTALREIDFAGSTQELELK